jgi:photosystem II stability/assembly factor-like uncharacterized protein
MVSNRVFGSTRCCYAQCVLMTLLCLIGGVQAQQWKAIGPWKSDVASIIAFDDSLLLAINCNSLFSSEDRGVSWTHLDDASLRPAWKTSLLASLGAVFMVYPDSAAYRSVDRGTTWNRLAFFSNAYKVQGFAARNDTVMFLTRDSVLFVSFDNGFTWGEKPSAGLRNATSLCDMAFTSSGIVAGGNSGVYRLLFNDTAWTRVDTGGVMAVRASDSVICTISIFDYIHPTILRCSFDNGTTWQSRQFANSASPNLFYDKKLFVLCTSDGQFISKDNARSWEQHDFIANSGLDHVKACWIAGGLVFLATYRYELHRSQDYGATWDGVRPRFGGMRAQSLCTYKNTLFAAGKGGGMCLYDPARQRWDDMSLVGLDYLTDQSKWPYFYSLHIAGISDSVTICSVDRQYIFMLPSSQNVWRQMLYTMDANMNDCKMVSDSMVIYGTGGWCSPPNCTCIDMFGGLAAITDGNGNFQNYSGRTIYTLPSCAQQVYTVAAHKNLVFAGTNYGIENFSRTDSLWQKTGTMQAGYPVTTIKEVAGMIVAASSQELLVSFDQGATWKGRPLPTANDPISALAGIGSFIIAGTSSGVFYSRDSGATWTGLAGSFKNAGVLDFAIINTTLFAGTDGAGVYMRDLTDILGPANAAGRKPAGPSLRFSPLHRTAANLEIIVFAEQAQPLVLRVFDAAGRLSYARAYTTGKGTSVLAIPSARLPRGIGFILVSTPSGTELLKKSYFTGN